VQAVYPEALVVHRLDMATSGIIVMARGQDIQRAMNRLFENRQVDKAYEAVVNGYLSPEKGSVDLPLICDWPNRPRQMVDHTIGKPSLTHYEVLAYDEKHDTSRVQLIPHTGRSHQLRVHMQALGHPILGDDLYATPEALAKADRLLLHATKIAFQHPVTGENVCFTQAPSF
jgi:tRNA pseudouridine32 synthase/23S rRNA pseudouridine746 synthase